MNFNDLAALEPKLLPLFNEAAEISGRTLPENFCANSIWFVYDGHAGIKRRLMPLVGWDRQDGPELLQTSEAYDVVYQTIYDALPACSGNCGCFHVSQGRS